MITGFKIALLLLQIARSIISYIERQGAIHEGEQRILNLELEALARTAKIRTEVEAEVGGLTDAQVDAELNADFRDGVRTDSEAGGPG